MVCRLEELGTIEPVPLFYVTSEIEKLIDDYNYAAMRYRSFSTIGHQKTEQAKVALDELTAKVRDSRGAIKLYWHDIRKRLLTTIEIEELEKVLQAL